jgi:hypothetical protein
MWTSKKALRCVQIGSGSATDVYDALFDRHNIAVARLDAGPYLQDSWRTVIPYLAKTADFVLLVEPESANDPDGFVLLGMIVASGKPVVVISERERGGSSCPEGDPVSAIATLWLRKSDIATNSKLLDRFLANLRRPAGANGNDAAASLASLREKVNLLAGLDKIRVDPATAGLRFENWVSDTLKSHMVQFQAVGSQGEADNGVDFVCWFDDVDGKFSNPILVQLKVLTGRTKADQERLKSDTERLDHALRRSDAQLGIVIYLSLTGQRIAASAIELPSILIFSAEDFVTALVTGRLAKEISKRQIHATVRARYGHQ